MFNRRGNSIITWSVTFAVVVAVLGFYRMTLKRPLANKMQQTTDYMLWNFWRVPDPADPDETISMRREDYRANTNVAAKVYSETSAQSRNLEGHDRPLRFLVDTTHAQRGANAMVSDGADAVLKTFDLNQAVE